MKVFLYERVSSEEQVKHGYSLDAQHEALTEFCQRNNHVILGVYKDEGISARKPYSKRPAMVQLLRDLELIKPDMILFTKLDRWFRNIKEYYKVQDILDRNKVDWKAINEEYDTSTASGRLYVNIKLSIAQDEADRTSERIKDVHSQLIAQGQILGGNAPLGYKIVDKRVVFGENIYITKEAIEYYFLHRTVTGTTRYINEKYGFKYDTKAFRDLFRNPILKGERHGNNNFCEPLITHEEFERLQEMLKSNIKQSSSHRVYLFTGLITCPVCGRKMASSHDKYRNYYRCNNRYNGLCSMRHTVREYKLEKWLLDNVEEDFKVSVTMKPTEKKENPKKYKDRLKRLNDVYLLGNITEAEYREKSAELQKIIADLSKSEPQKEVKFSKNWKDIYSMLDAEHKRSFWRNLIKGVKIDEEANVLEIMF